jgi:predicted porin
MGGFTAQAQVAAGEGVTPRNLGFNVRYTAGPLDVGLGFNDIDSAATNRHWNLVGSWDLGMVKPIVGYAKGEVGAVDTKQFVLGARAPVGPGTLKAVFARSTTSTAGVDVDTDKFGIGYEYALSKRTSVHADYGTAKADAPATRSNGFEFGVKHVF